jgi:antitoxin YefM
LALWRKKQIGRAKCIGGFDMDAITANQAKENIDGLIQKVISNAEATITCNDRGEKAVLLSLEEFNSWNETLYLLSNPANAEHLRQSIAEDRVGERKERELISS